MKRSVLALGVISAGVLLAGCGQSPVAPAQSSDNLATIDPAITGMERQIVEGALKDLPPQDRKNVIVLTSDGKAYSNRVGLASEVQTLRQLSPTTAKTPDGRVIGIPELQPKIPVGVSAQATSVPSCNLSDGPYRRISSRVGTGVSTSSYGWIRANLSLPGSTAAKLSTTSGNGYVTFGGWGSGTTGSTIDAGLQYNQFSSGVSDPFWSGYVAQRQYGASSAVIQTLGRFVPGSFTMSFYVTSDGNTALKISGTPKPGTNTVSPSTIYIQNSTGWTKNGAGNIVKRFQSITNANPDDYITGIAWSSVQTGASVNTSTGAVTGLHNWTPSDTATTNGICNVTSTTAGTTGAISVSPSLSTTSDSETVSIYF